MVTFSGDSTDNASISGFKITGSTDSDGIYCGSNADPTITNNVITGNARHGIYCDNHSDPKITNNTITGNQYGIVCSYS
ncbi:MAG: right-handed parallel beta-helix repeat-containing protein [bacterium]|nr:right-handed parallel beta-helix repeat-containing protein [bacterium]